MNPESENPAGRLRSVLENLRVQPPSLTAAEGWANILGVSQNDTASIILALGKTIELSERAQRALLDANIATEVTQKWVTAFEMAISQSADLRRPLRLSVLHLTDAAMLSLQACEDSLVQHSSTPVSDNHINEAIRLTDLLLHELHEANLESRAHEMMTRHILALQQSLKLYPVVGPDGIYDEILASMAALSVVMRPNDPSMPWYQRFKTWMTEIGDWLSLGQTITEDVTQVVQTLPPGVSPFGSGQ
jgi:hypothetical protein